MRRSGKQIIMGATLVAVSSAALAADLTVSALFGGMWEKSLRECVISRSEAAAGKIVRSPKKGS